MTITQWTWGGLLNDSYQNEYQEGYLELTPDAGIPFRRMKFSDIQDIVSGSLSLTDSDYTAFMSWYKHDIRQGTLPFQMYDCRIKQMRVARLTMNKPQFMRNSNRWNITLTITYDSGVFSIPAHLLANTYHPLVANGKILCANITRYL